VCRSKHIEPSINFGIINSITKLHLVGIYTESSTMHGCMNIKTTLLSLVSASGLYVLQMQGSCAVGVMA
jgi:hypothetical protein